MSYFLLASGILFIAYIIYTELKKKQTVQLTYIANYEFPKRVKESVLKTYPHLNEADTELVLQGLRDFFHISNQAKGQMVSMPSQVVDVAWHEFILFTKAYQNFCQKAFGKFFHHHPAEAMKSPTIAQEGIKRAWNLACTKEDIYPKTPDRLPLLFALDMMLNIPDGFKYTLNCQTSNSGYCASDIGCGGGGCAGGDTAGDSGCGGGD